MPRNIRYIDLAGIRSNTEAIKSGLPANVKLLAVVKADAYGHGAFETAKAVLNGGADMLSVAAVGEGKYLREQGVSAPILILGAASSEESEEAVRYGLIQTVCSAEMIRFCEENARRLQKQTEVHLKIDTGMGRIGIRTEKEKKEVLDELKRSPHVSLTGVFTHFSDADGDEEGESYTREQFRRFIRMTEGLPEGIIRHCCNSAAIHRYPEMCLDMVRAGISLYGYPPVKTPVKMKPCMSWTAKISYIKNMPAGEYISYGRTYRTDKQMRLATVTCGYADGYHRCAGERAYVLIRGRKAKIIGRICMDQMMADVTEIPDAQIGDEVILMGQEGNESISAEDLAEWSGTISYEILLSVGSRVARLYRHETKV